MNDTCCKLANDARDLLERLKKAAADSKAEADSGDAKTPADGDSDDADAKTPKGVTCESGDCDCARELK